MARVVGEVLAALAAVPGLRVIVVDDGSTDDTAGIAERLAASNPRVRVVRSAQNLGYGGALRLGFAATTAPWVFYTDGDGQIDPAQLPPVLHELDGADVLIGRRVRRAEGLRRTLNAALWTWLVNRVFGMRFEDVDCAFKLFPGEALRSWPLQSAGALVSAELLARATRAGLRVVQVPVMHRARTAGAPTGANLRVILRAFRELFALAGEIKGGR